MPKTFHILSIWIFTESFQGSYHCFYVTFQNTETQKFNNVSKNFKAKIFVLAGWGGKSKHHIIFAFIFYATKLYFVYNVNFVAFQSRSHSQFFVTPWTVAHQVPLSIGFSKQEYWSELPFPPPGDLPNPGTEPASLASPALAGRFFTTEAPRKLPSHKYTMFNIAYMHMYVCMYMNLSCFSYHDISSVKAEMTPISYFQIFMKSNGLVNSSLDLCFLSKKNLSGRFIWWILETNRMCRCLDLRQIVSIGLQEFNVKCLMSNTVQNDIRREVLILISSGKVDIDLLCNWKEWTH